MRACVRLWVRGRRLPVSWSPPLPPSPGFQEEQKSCGEDMDWTPGARTELSGATTPHSEVGKHPTVGFVHECVCVCFRSCELQGQG